MWGMLHQPVKVLVTEKSRLLVLSALYAIVRLSVIQADQSKTVKVSIVNSHRTVAPSL